MPPGRAAGGDPRRWAGRTRGAMAPGRPRARSGGAEQAAGGERRSRAGTGRDGAGDQAASAAAAGKRGAPRLRLGGRGRGRGTAADRPWRDPAVAAVAAWAVAERWVQGRGWYADSAPAKAEELGGVGGVEGGRRAGGGDGCGGGVRGAGGEFFLAGDQASPCAWDRGTRRTNYLRHMPEIVAHGEFIPTPSGSGHTVFLLFCAVYLDKYTTNVFAMCPKFDTRQTRPLPCL